MSRLRRLLQRPSARLTRSILIPLTVIHLVITAYALVVSNRAARSIAYDRIEGIAQAIAMNEPPTTGVLNRLGEWIEADRVWVVSATGRILASNRAGEINALVDDVWWKELPHDARRIRRETEWGGRNYVQVAYHDVERGLWSMVIADLERPFLRGAMHLGALLLLSLCVWLLVAGVIVLAIRRTVGRPLDLSDLIARRALSGEPTSSASLARIRAAANGFGPARRLLELVDRMQERATRANEAESRFGLTVELLPGIAYLAAYDGTLLYPGPVLRQRLGTESFVGQPVADLVPELPLRRVHRAAEQSLNRGVTFDNLPVREHTADIPAMVASIRSVQFRGTAAYLAHLEAVDDAGVPDRSGAPSVPLEAQLLDSAREIIIAFDSSTRTLVWNARAEALTGVPALAVPDLRAAIERLFPGDEATAAFAEWMDQGPEAEPMERPFVATDGTRYAITWSARELQSDGRTLGGALFGVPMELPVEEDRHPRKRRRIRPRRRRAQESTPDEEGGDSGATTDSGG